MMLGFLSPLLAAIALLIRATSPGPAFFRQTRVGRRGQLFTIYKFRTMCADAERQLLTDPVLRADYLARGYKLPLDDDPRITRIGAVLRKLSIDELPQLLNVVRGEMSLVGPRPVVPDELAEYDRYVDAYLMAIPGLTGLWQVAGRDAIGYPGRAELDARYIDTWSLGNDLRILLKTVPATLGARGVR